MELHVLKYLRYTAEVARDEGMGLCVQAPARRTGPVREARPSERLRQDRHGFIDVLRHIV